jgi:hypothetical protein
MVTDIHVMIEELLEAVCSVRSSPRLYLENGNRRAVNQAQETGASSYQRYPVKVRRVYGTSQVRTWNTEAEESTALRTVTKKRQVAY